MAELVITEPAEYDLLDIEYYIYVHLCNLQAADRIVDGILKTLHDLKRFPEMHPYVEDALLSSLSIRMAWFDNYNIFYYYDKDSEKVHILRILYNRVDWRRILKRQ